ncbi:glycoside hydrolase family 15 protein [Paracidobacterium acidisoli]|uniref:Glycoside hydrolase family 15 protein n=1 Tax=Paracidobacterium acidisoli TaxID=2303751 RepID=A0A372IL59_9BACT|nr:glycoside hydrolase family 15 protein [Paracidobacterium acidisoli]MBT9332892.1 glycoside hydrolase family 15 protein [Paracidobacterium acidisoli]
MAQKIEDYAVIGDCETAALVGRNGSVDWLCWPDFASDACFAALLGSEENGYWKISPTEGEWTTTRRYVDHTLILETTFESDQGAVRLIDFMPIRGINSDLVRIVEGVRGQVPMRMELALRFDYGHILPWVTRIEDGIRAVAGPALTVLHGSVETHGEDLTTVAEFTVGPGDREWFTLTYGASHRPDPKPIDVEEALRDTERFWNKWISRAWLDGECSDAIERSLITLKALTYRPTGGVVAAVTTSLPECLGGRRNWDYRYCWLRDTTFTLLALMNAGFYEEATAWQEWLLRALAGSPDQVQIMYSISGNRQLPEWEVSWLPGYESSAPVRVGNGASLQTQLDIYGEVLDAFFHSQHGMRRRCAKDFPALQGLVEHLADIWQQPDEGIWETRGGPQQFTYSKVMAWVAFDRAVMLAEKLNQENAPVEKWKTVRDAIHAEICAKAFDAKSNSFMRSYGSSDLDASLLLMPMVGFLPWSDSRVRGTVEAVERHLTRDGFVLRYDSTQVEDGLPPGEGVFLACSFWMVSALKGIGREDDARALFRRLLTLRNDVGLLAEEYDVNLKRQVGNFPQAFSHISLVNAAFDLEGSERVQKRSHRSHAQGAGEPVPSTADAGPER